MEAIPVIRIRKRSRNSLQGRWKGQTKEVGKYHEVTAYIALQAGPWQWALPAVLDAGPCTGGIYPGQLVPGEACRIGLSDWSEFFYEISLCLTLTINFKRHSLCYKFVWKRLLKIRGAVWKNCPLWRVCNTVLKGSVRAHKGFLGAQLFQSTVPVWTLLPNWLETSSRLEYF